MYILHSEIFIDEKNAKYYIISLKQTVAKIKTCEKGL